MAADEKRLESLTIEWIIRQVRERRRMKDTLPIEGAMTVPLEWAESLANVYAAMATDDPRPWYIEGNDGTWQDAYTGETVTPPFPGNASLSSRGHPGSGPANGDDRPPYDDLATLVREIAAMHEHGTIANGDGGYRFCPFCRAEQHYDDEARRSYVDHDGDCLYVRSCRLAAHLPHSDDRAAAAWADRVAMFILHKIVDADDALTLSEIAPNLTAPHGWISFAKLWRADYIDVQGEFVTPTEAGIAAMRDFAARLPPDGTQLH